MTKIVPSRVLKLVIGWVTSFRDRFVSRENPNLLDMLNRGNWLSSLLNPGLPGVNVKLIEPLRGPSTYTEHINKNGEGIHRIGCFAYNDPQAIVKKYEDEGISIIQSGNFEGLQFWYFDTIQELNGLILEIAANLWAIRSQTRSSVDRLCGGRTLFPNRCIDE